MANSIDPFIPELWANESVAILEEQMVMSSLVHRDFEPIIARYGETVHTRKPAEFKAIRKTKADNVTTQDATATDIEVKLNQHAHVSFVIKDEEQTKSFQDLIETYLRPAMLAESRLLDRVIAGQAAQFLGNTRGGLGMLSSSNAQAYLVATREKLNRQKAYEQGRNLVLGPASESAFLNTAIFTSAEQVGDSGQAVRDARLGRKFGLETFMDLNIPSVSSAVVAGTSSAGAAIAAGATGGTLANANALGQYFTLAGDMQPLRATNTSTTATWNRALNNAVLSGGVLTKYSQGTVDNASGYAVGHVGYVHVDGLANGPHVGQLVAFNDTVGTAIRTPEYVIVDAINTSSNDWDILLDRPLETVLADDDVVCYGPNGELNLAFHRHAIALVSRPLVLPPMGAGARAAVANYNGMAMRVTITYDGLAQGTRVTVDGLFGVKVLDTDLGCVLLG